MKRDPKRIRAMLQRWASWRQARYPGTAPDPRLSSAEFWLLGSILTKLDAWMRRPGLSGSYGDELAERCWTVVADAGARVTLQMFLRSYKGMAVKAGVSQAIIAASEPRKAKRRVAA